MNNDKRTALIKELSASPVPDLIPIARFFDGNDDLGSIGCNLKNHPGIEAFRSTFAELSARSDVQAIYAQIAEVDPGYGAWPFSDTVFIFGDMSKKELQQSLASLRPDEVSDATSFGISQAITSMHATALLVAWWD